MERAGFVILSALAPLAVGTVGLGVFGFFMGWSLPDTSDDYGALWHLFLMAILPAQVAAAIAAYVSISNPRFHRWNHWAQTSRVFFLTYMFHVPLFAAAVFLNWSSFDGWGVVVVYWGIVLIVSSTIPFLLLEYLIIGMARSG